MVFHLRSLASSLLFAALAVSTVSATRVAAAERGGGIQWYATLDAGLREAKRSGRPILFLSAAPHCGGVSGVW